VNERFHRHITLSRQSADGWKSFTETWQVSMTATIERLGCHMAAPVEENGGMGTRAWWLLIIEEARELDAARKRRR
jgi:hypothetical protein